MLKVHIFGGGFHLCGQRADDFVRLAGEERQHLVEQTVIFLAGNIARARSAAFADVVHEARPLPPRDHARDILFALADWVVLAHQRKSVP
ncbi:hypothetical protein SDC9_80037 [bioreactor metagenome]|uniref:Uncharacterized protein n=1 Tax=bioreactor metagenome TaxID=1076179 RepID=A0A644YYB4_9ZZZZ